MAQEYWAGRSSQINSESWQLWVQIREILPTLYQVIYEGTVQEAKKGPMSKKPPAGRALSPIASG